MKERTRWTRRSTPYTLAATLRDLLSHLDAQGWAIACNTDGLPSHVFLKVSQATPYPDAWWLARCTGEHGYDVTWRGVRAGFNLFKLEEIVQPEAFIPPGTGAHCFGCNQYRGDLDAHGHCYDCAVRLLD